MTPAEQKVADALTIREVAGARHDVISEVCNKITQMREDALNTWDAANKKVMAAKAALAEEKA